MNQELMNHLIELRKRILFILLGIAIAFLLLFKSANNLYALLAKPLLSLTMLNSKLIAIDLTSPFLVPMKLTLICACLVSIPNTLYHIWQFLAPAMFKPEKKILAMTTISSIILFGLGIMFCYFIILPAFFAFISHFKSNLIEMTTDISKYLDFILNLFLVFGLSFQTPIMVFLLIYFNIVSYHQLKKMRPYVFVGVFVVAAIITPPDVLSQTMLAIPLYLLYELGMVFGFIIKPKGIQ